MAVEEFNQGKNLIDWIATSDRVFVVLFCILAGVILVAAYFMFRRLMKLLDETKLDLEKEREGSRKEREEYFKTIGSMQEILNNKLASIDNNVKELNAQMRVKNN